MREFMFLDKLVYITNNLHRDHTDKFFPKLLPNQWTLICSHVELEDLRGTRTGSSQPWATCSSHKQKHVPRGSRNSGGSARFIILIGVCLSLFLYTLEESDL